MNRMSPRTRWWLFAATLAVLGAVAVQDGRLRAADHADSPDTSEGNLDINDVYAFNQDQNVVLIMTVAPLLTPGEATNQAALNPNGLYQFNLDAERDGIADAVIQVNAHGAGPSQTVSFRGPITPGSTGATATVATSTALSGAFNTTLSGNGMTAFAGPRDDPFFVNLFGDASVTSVLNAAFGAALGTQIGDASEQSLSFEDPAQDDLAGLNTLAIVVELPKADLADVLGIPVDGTFYLWGSTHVR